MKKILSILILATVLTTLAAPVMVSAEGPNECCKLKSNFETIDSVCKNNAIVGPREMTAIECPEGAVTAGNVTDKWGLCCLLSTIHGITNLIFILLMAVSVVLILAGGFTILTAGGAADQVEKGKNYITYAVVGIAVALLARVIPSIVSYII